MKAKKVMAMAMVMTMGLSMTTLGVSAAESKGTTNVSYSNQNEIPDPTDPTNPDWMVTIPSSIVFTDDNKEIDASVELIKKAGELPDSSTPVSVSVESQNVYNLQLADSSDPVSYTLSYGSNLMSDTLKRCLIYQRTIQKRQELQN